ncbi:MAG: LysM peptidoglycan-binding domain-containing protein [Planctomycetota bacterium]
MHTKRALRGAALGVFALGLLAAVAGPTHASTFTVENGDTLAAIAQRNGIPAWVLEKANPQFVGKKLFKGDQVRLPKRLVIVVVAAVDTRVQTQQDQPNAYPIGQPTQSNNPNTSGGGSPAGGSGQGQNGQGQSNPLQDLMKLFNGGNNNGQNNNGQNNNGQNNGSGNSGGSGFPAPSSFSPSSSGGSSSNNSGGTPGNSAATTPEQSQADKPISEQLREEAQKRGLLTNQARWDEFCLELVRMTYKTSVKTGPKGGNYPAELPKDLSPDDIFDICKKAIPDLVKEGESAAPKGAVIFLEPSGGKSGGRMAYSSGGGKAIVEQGGQINPSVDVKTLGKQKGYIIIRKHPGNGQGGAQPQPAQTVTRRA